MAEAETTETSTLEAIEAVIEVAPAIAPEDADAAIEMMPEQTAAE
jgi:hypothetical protein